MADLEPQDAAFADAGAGEGEVEQSTDATQTSEPTEQVAQPGESEDPQAVLKGTSFKDVASLAQGYKNIQRLVASKDREIREISQKFNELLYYIQQSQQQRGQQPQEQPEDFWNRFTSKPKETMAELIEARVQEALQKVVNPLQSDLGSLRNQSEVQTFLRAHPEFTEADEDAMVEILRQKPWLRNSPTRLEDAYEILHGRRARETRTRDANTNAVKDAKISAGLGGKKSAVPNLGNRDEFDAVLEDDKAFRDLFKLGRSS